MSDLCTYEFEDIVWDVFCQSDDHIVPHPSDEQANASVVQGNNSKRRRHEVSCLARDFGQQNSQQKAEQESLTLYGSSDKMLEKYTWSHKPDNVLCSSSNNEQMKQMPSLASDITRTSSHCFKNDIESVDNELCANDSILNDRSTAASSSLVYPLNHISEADNGVGFFGNSHEDKDSSDLLYYGWPDIGNFEDVDRMFRSCDSTFGVGANNEDDFALLSSSVSIGGSGDALKSDFNFSCLESSETKNISEIHDPSTLNCTINESTMQTTSVTYSDNSWPSSKDESSHVGHFSFSSGSSASDSKDGLLTEEPVNVPKKQLKVQNGSEMDRKKDQYLENGSFFSINNMQEVVRQQSQAVGSESFGYLQSDMPYMHSEYSDHTSANPSSFAVKLKDSCLTSLSPKDSYASDCSNYPSFQSISNGTRGKLHQQHVLQASFGNRIVDSTVRTSKDGPILGDHRFGHDFQIDTDANGVELGTPAELGSSVIHESSSMKSGSDDISVEATSFHQLQLVMQQLDLRTKLCIRDSLYRLAQSAEQRRTCAKQSGVCANDGDVDAALMAQGKHKYTAFVNMETDTNPIDRSVAHLLFHRPSDSSATPGNDSASFSSATPIHGSICSSP